MRSNVAIVYLSEINSTSNLNMSAEYWVKRKNLEEELNESCMFSVGEKEIILTQFDLKHGNLATCPS